MNGDNKMINEFELKVKRLTPSGRIDPPAKKNDAGHDVYATKDVEIASKERYAMPLGVALEFPEGYVCIVTDKSGIASKYGLHSIGAVVDNCYRGEIYCILVNSGKEPVYVNKGQKIAQLIFYQCFTTDEIKYVEELSETSRNIGKFGSTGV